MTRGVLAVATVLACCATQAVGQSFHAGATAVGLRLTRRTATPGTASGAGIGIEGGVRYRLVSLAVRYRQGSLSGTSPSIDQDFVEGEIMASVRVARWIHASLGPHVRAYVEPTGTERWLLWEARVRFEAALLPAVTGFLEIGRVLSADLNVAQSFDSGSGIEGGVQVRVPGAPVRVRLRYRTEHARLGDGSRRETLEQFGLVVTTGRR